MTREWQSPLGKRWIEGSLPDGRVLVRTEGTTLSQIVSAAELDREIYRDEANARSRRAARERGDAEQVSEAAMLAGKRDLHGFTSGMASVKARKIEAALDKLQGFSGKYMKRRVFIEQAVADGASVGVFKGKRTLEMPSGSFYTERDVTATGLDYAEYLIALEA